MKGIYRTDYGNAAVVDSEISELAYDLDAGEIIPAELVTADYVRNADPEELELLAEAVDNWREGCS